MIPIIPIVALSIASSVLYVNYSYDKIVYGSLKNKRKFLKGEITLKEDNKEEVKEEAAAVEGETKLEKVEGEIVEKDKEDIIKEYENSAPIKKKDIGPNSPFTIIPEEETHAPKFDTLKEEGKKMSELDNVVEEKPVAKVEEEPENVVEEKVEEKPAKKPAAKKTTTKAKSTTEKKTTKKTTKKSEEKVEEKPAKKPAAKKTDTKKTTSKKSEKADKKESEDK